MTSMPLEVAQYGTAWRRTLPLLALGLTLIGVLAGLARSQVLGLGATLYSRGPGAFSAAGLTGEDIAFGAANLTRTRADGSTESIKVLRAGLSTAQISEFCYSYVEELPLLGSFTVRVTAGDGDPGTYEVSAENLVLDLDRIRASEINLDGEVQIGLATSDVSTVPGLANPLDAPEGTGYLGVDATRGVIHGASGYLRDVEIGGPAELPGLSISVKRNGAQCAVAGLG